MERTAKYERNTEDTTPVCEVHTKTRGIHVGLLQATELIVNVYVLATHTKSSKIAATTQVC